MNHTILRPLAPGLVTVKTAALEGKLYIEGSVEGNVLRFCFSFAEGFEASPLRITVKAGEREYSYYCNIETKEKRIMKTPVFCPDFCVGLPWSLEKVEPLVKINLKGGQGEEPHISPLP
jgi:hypothetical protein